MDPAQRSEATRWSFAEAAVVVPVLQRGPGGGEGVEHGVGIETVRHGVDQWLVVQEVGGAPPVQGREVTGIGVGLEPPVEVLGAEK